MRVRQIRFLTDENVNVALADALRRREHDLDVQTAREAGTLGWPDERVLAYASSQGRILVTHDRQTMPDILATFVAQGNTSPGVIIIPAGHMRETIEGILVIWGASGPEEWLNRLTWLPL